MSDLHQSLRQMGLPQLLLALLFLCSYGIALGSLFGPLGRWRAGGVAAASAVAFGFFTDPWEHAVMLIAFALIGFGLFIALAWLLARLPAWFTTTPEPVMPLDTAPALLREEAVAPARMPVPAPRRPGLGL